jgi:hypothetical protein
VPEITITIDGQKLNIPASPIMSTNQNGYTECNHYQLYGPLKDGANIQAHSNDPNVKFSISTSITNSVSTGNRYRATVEATYNGVTKYFLIN